MSTSTEIVEQGSPARSGRYHLGGWLLVLAALYLVGELIAVAGWRGRPYEWAGDAISALGVPERQTWGAEVGYSTRHALMNATFALTGLRALAAALVLAPFAPRRGRRTVRVLSALYGLGLVLIALFPSGSTTAREVGHGVGAVLVLFGGTVLLAALTVHLSGTHRGLTVFTGLCALVAVIGLIGMPTVLGSFGLFERVTVDALVLWQVVLGVVVLAARPPREAQPGAGDSSAG